MNQPGSVLAMRPISLVFGWLVSKEGACLYGCGSLVA
jgi:hypothetical protein